MIVDLHKQDVRELGTFLSLNRKYEGIDKEEIFSVYKGKLEEETRLRNEKHQKKIDRFHTELKNLFDQGYYKGSVLTKMCMSFGKRFEPISGNYRLVLTGKVLQYPNSIGYYEPMFCYYLESDADKKVSVIGLSLGPVLEVQTFSKPIKTFDEIVASSKGCEYYLE